MSKSNAKRRVRKTNVEMLTHVMEYSRHGALMQAFVIEACARYAKQCAATDPAEFDSGLLSGAAWVGCAKELKAALDEHLAS